jgi:tetratricopeptide (TPR) repeat protein
MIVRDEEHNLPDCLRSAAGLFDEVVVVDTGSKDRTRELAVSLGARVFDFPWCDSFAAARNESLRHATGDWCFWLDADDRLDDDNRDKLGQLFASLGDENAAYSVKCLCLPEGPGGPATVVDHIRLFRNRPDVRWRYRVHEQILPAVRDCGGRVRWSGATVRHTGYCDAALRRRKLGRDLRLLGLEQAERPDDPFTLFNLGSVHNELGRPAEALPLLQKSLRLSHPNDSIVRKLYALVIACHRALGQRGEAEGACAEGLRVCPGDAELLFLDSVLRRERGDVAGAMASLLRLVAERPAEHFASVDTGLRGYKARHNLGVLLLQQGRAEEAAGHWRQAAADRPDFLPAWLGLAECALRRGDREALEDACRHAQALPDGPPEAAALRARWHLNRREFAEARRLLEEARTHFPAALAPRVTLSHALLQEGADLDAAEAALREVLALDPSNAEAKHNLEVLHRQRRAQSGGS